MEGGVIIGRRSYGKGLVQEQYDLPDGAALRLTIARYYTPSGRSIQRSFSNGKEAYMEEYENRFESAALANEDTAVIADTTKFYTSRTGLYTAAAVLSPMCMCRTIPHTLLWL